MAEIRLIATDLDGTLIATPAKEFHLYTDFRQKINNLRQQFNCVWAICTSRRLSSFRRFFIPMATMDLVPDFVIAGHAYIYRRTRLGYMPHILWNIRIAYIQWLHSLNVRKAIQTWHREIVSSFPKVKTIRRSDVRLWLRFSSEEVLGKAVEMLQPKVAAFRLLKIFRYRTELDIRAVPFTKGLAVQELSGHLGVGRECVLAIGNGHNDASMLDGTVAAMVGCPMNSEPEVVEVVHKARGHIAGAPSLEGTIDVIDAHIYGQVRSDLPGWWTNPATFDPGDERQPHRARHSGRYPFVTGMILLASVTYMTLLVFAIYNVIPYSRLIRAPWDLALKVLYKTLETIGL